ncbi:TPA: SIR2 family protein, partial [Yersinia enterocolitica]|nr:SIR2 family protein [Yersinia enterocolitica]
MKDDLSKAFKAKELYDKNINFLFGSGASASYIPTLKIKDDLTYEDLLTNKNYKMVEDFIYYHYCKTILKKSYCLKPLQLKQKISFRRTLIDYMRFIKLLSELIKNKSANQIRRANIFTTNYDLFMERAADNLSNNSSFIFNDGARGLNVRHLSISNFHTSTWHQGTNDLYKFEIPTINLIKMHGSVSWNKVGDDAIRIIYPSKYPNLLNVKLENRDSLLTSIDIIEEQNIIDDSDVALSLCENDKNSLKQFRIEYDKLAIVNPTKLKFEETVLQQHYYQSLRLLSYELEKPQTVLICFGFSFKDEHIREII